MFPTGSITPGKDDFQANMLHEIGHGLGLRHTITSTDDLMYPLSQKGLAAVNRQGLASGSNQTVPAIQRQVDDSKAVKWMVVTPSGIPIANPVYPLGATLPTTALTITPTLSAAPATTVGGGQTKTFSITTNGSVVNGQTYRWKFFDTNNTWRYCDVTATVKAIFTAGYNEPTLSVAGLCGRTIILKDTVSIRCEISDGCTIKSAFLKLTLPYVKRNIKQTQKICTPTNFLPIGSDNFVPAGGTFTCTGCAAGALSSSTLDTAGLVGPVTLTYTAPNGCSTTVTVSRKAPCRACIGFSVLNANDVCIYNNQAATDYVAYTLDNTGCPPINAIYKAEMIPSLIGTWSNPILIGQTTNSLIDIPITISGSQASGTYLVRVAIYTANGVFVESSINTKVIQIGRPSGLNSVCNFAPPVCSGCSGRILNVIKTATLYPNPTADHFTLEIPSFEKATDISIADMQGRIIYTYQTNETSNQINTVDYPVGMYFVQIRQGEALQTLKLVILR